MLSRPRKTFLLIAVCFIFWATASDRENTLEPWIFYPNECDYDHCVEVNFDLVPPAMEVSGGDSDFSEKFLLEAQEGPEEGSDTCTKFDPLATKCLFSKENVRVKDGTLQLLVPGGFKPNETITVAQVSSTR
jgi:hypothetical protein